MTNQPSEREDADDVASAPSWSDPTAPIWADPTSQLPAPTGSDATAGPQDTPLWQPVAPGPPAPAAPQPAQPPHASWQPSAGSAPAGNPYGYSGDPAQSYPQPSYPQPVPSYGQPGSPYYGTQAPVPGSAIALTIVAGLTMLSSCLIGIPSFILGLMALSANSNDPALARRRARTGWIVYAVNWALAVVGVVGVLVVVAASGGFEPSTTP